MFVILPLISLEKYWEVLKLFVADNKLSKIIISSLELKFYHWQQILSVVFIEMTDSFYSHT